MSHPSDEKIEYNNADHEFHFPSVHRKITENETAKIQLENSMKMDILSVKQLDPESTTRLYKVKQTELLDTQTNQHFQIEKYKLLIEDMISQKEIYEKKTVETVTEIEGKSEVMEDLDNAMKRMESELETKIYILDNIVCSNLNNSERNRQGIFNKFTANVKSLKEATVRLENVKEYEKVSKMEETKLKREFERTQMVYDKHLEEFNARKDEQTKKDLELDNKLIELREKQVQVDLECEKTKKECEERRKSYNNVQEKIKIADEQLKDIYVKKLEKYSKVVDLKNKVITEMARVSIDKEKRVEMERKITEAMEKKQNLLRIQQELDSEIAKKQKIADQLLKEDELLKQQTEMKYEKLKKLNENSTKEIEELEVKHLQIDAEILESKKQITTLRHTHTTQLSTNHNLTPTTSLHQITSSLTAQLSSITSQLAAAHADSLQLAQTQSNLQTQLADAEGKLAAQADVLEGAEGKLRELGVTVAGDRDRVVELVKQLRDVKERRSEEVFSGERLKREIRLEEGRRERLLERRREIEREKEELESGNDLIITAGSSNQLPPPPPGILKSTSVKSPGKTVRFEPPVESTTDTEEDYEFYLQLFGDSMTNSVASSPVKRRTTEDGSNSPPVRLGKRARSFL